MSLGPFSYVWIFGLVIAGVMLAEMETKAGYAKTAFIASISSLIGSALVAIPALVFPLQLISFVTFAMGLLCALMAYLDGGKK